MREPLCVFLRDCFDHVRAWSFTWSAVLLLTACSGSAPTHDEAEAGCAADCAGRDCGSDGCGGTCGACAEPLVCDPFGLCVEPPDEPQGCTQTCEEAGLECGEVCGVSCGTCTGAQTTCVDGRCACLPACSVAACEQADGCGASCGPCPTAESCTDCVLKLSIVDHVIEDGLVSEITVALDFQPGADQPLPTMADLRLLVSGPAQLTAVGVATAVLDADKELLSDPNTGKPFRVLEGGVHQILVYSIADATPIQAGRWLLLRFRLGPESKRPAADWAREPTTIRLVQREETFAPGPSDTVLWSGGFTAPIVVWADQGGAP